MPRSVDDRHASGDVPEGPERAGPLRRSVCAELDRLAAKTLSPGLYLVATPIGNLSDITLRALHVLQTADLVYCEDTRTSARLLQHYAISARTRALHEHNEEGESERVIAEVSGGKRVAMISDAGMPLISDPGFKLVRAAHEAGIGVSVVPGASAVPAAVALSGLPTDVFTFAGFLPPRPGARRTRLRELDAAPGTLVLFEAPQRVGETLADMADVLGARSGAVGRELTKLHEEMVRGTLADLAKVYAGREVKGEVVILAGPPERVPASDEEITAFLADALATMRLKEAANAIAGKLGVPKSRVYDLGLKLKQQPAEEP